MSVFRAGLFKGRTAIVTGGGSGIGKAIATELLTLGCNVVVASRSFDRVEKASELMSAFVAKQSGVDGGDILPLRCNIRVEEDVRTAVEMTLERFGAIDFLVNNGGGQFPCPAKDMSLKGWNAVIETNLTGTFLMSREVFNRWWSIKGGGECQGAIVNIVCDMFRGFPTMSHTGAARAGVENLTRSMAVEFADTGVRVNCVAPGVIYSKSASQNYETDIFAMYEPHIPAKRLGTPEEVASAVCFLLSPGSAFISGATLRVDAGSSLAAPLLYPISDAHGKMPAYRWQGMVDQDGGAGNP